MIESQNPALSVRRQCELLGLNRTTLYYTAAQESVLNLKTPFYGYRRMTIALREQGYGVNPKRIQRLMHTVMGV